MLPSYLVYLHDRCAQESRLSHLYRARFPHGLRLSFSFAFRFAPLYRSRPHRHCLLISPEADSSPGAYNQAPHPSSRQNRPHGRRIRSLTDFPCRCPHRTRRLQLPRLRYGRGHIPSVYRPDVPDLRYKPSSPAGTRPCRPPERCLTGLHTLLPSPEVQTVRASVPHPSSHGPASVPAPPGGIRRQAQAILSLPASVPDAPPGTPPV